MSYEGSVADDCVLAHAAVWDAGPVQGRIVVAVGDVPPHTVVCRADAYCVSPLQEHKKRMCSRCLRYAPKRLERKCGLCNQAWFCEPETPSASGNNSTSSSGCTHCAAVAPHEAMCPALAHFSSASSRFDKQIVAMLRLMLEVLWRSHTNSGRGKEEAAVDLEEGAASGSFDALVHHPSAWTDKEVSEMRKPFAVLQAAVRCCPWASLQQRGGQGGQGQAPLHQKEAHHSGAGAGVAGVAGVAGTGVGVAGAGSNPEDSESNKPDGTGPGCAALSESSSSSSSSCAVDISLPRLERIFSQIESNAFGVNSPSGVPMGHAVYPRAAMFNHSCSPNCAVDDCNPAVLTVTTVAPVRSGEELTIAYCALDQPVAARRAHLLGQYNFSCACVRCEQEIASGRSCVSGVSNPVPQGVSLTVAAEDLADLSSVSQAKLLNPKQLKAGLKALGLSTCGNKKELVARLVEGQTAQAASSSEQEQELL